MLWGGFNCVESSYVVERNEIITFDEDVIFGGTLQGHFGHFMFECFSRLWYVIQNSELKSKILFVVAGWKYESWFDDFFRLMGIDKDRIIYVDKPTQCRSVTVPAQSEYNAWISVKYTKEFLLPYLAIKSNVTPGTKKKLYLTRTKFDAKGTYKKQGHCFNEEYFEDFFTAHGFDVVSMEKLSVEEQISLIMGADEIAATLGSLTHWAIFSKPNAKFIMLNRTDNPVALQMFINDVFDVDKYSIVDASKSFMCTTHSNGIFLLGSNKYWKEFVADYFGEQIEEDDDAPYLEESWINT